MGIFGRFLNKETDSEKTVSLSEINEYFRRKDEGVGSDLSEVTYFTCLKVLSESLGKLSIHLKDGDGNKVKDNGVLELLALRPNPFMSSVTFKTLMEFNRNHYGNAYAYLRYERGKLKSIVPLKPQNMSILVNNTRDITVDFSHVYQYSESGKAYYFKPGEILHMKGGLAIDGLVGKSVRETLAGTLSGSKEAQRYLNNLYKNGLTANAIIKYVGDLNRDKKEKLVKEIADFASNDTNERIIPIPLGMDLVPLDLKLTDSQFYELKKYSALQIASAMGVKPNHLNDYEKSSYANSEAQNLTYYVDTLLYILTQYEEEFNYKLLSSDERKKGLHFEFNVATILRGDIKSQAEFLAKLTTGSVYTINEARSYLGMPRIDEGDVVMVNGSYVDLSDIGLAYKKDDSEGGEKSDKSTE
ncbi:phage portal protein, HK97 family [Peptostreptococcus anaerobius 653-L]|uniref:Phage portal protein, HK97 family n=1 Tax=Peptostreptococcus anaerobius 653-L TaxID=596329 RepID=D3MU67_9FIRM|nr:phage portal protein [Peptostreptococcus anaerobius]EFD04331.1 phage portal protein, HK97 family [Peptostreptococcus anaerobius 653-L]